jgi:hypothetical protein
MQAEPCCIQYHVLLKEHEHYLLYEEVESPPAKPVACLVSPSKGQKNHEPTKAASSGE